VTLFAFGFRVVRFRLRGRKFLPLRNRERALGPDRKLVGIVVQPVR